VYIQITKEKDKKERKKKRTDGGEDRTYSS
jgi:hypothetical protein